MTTNTRANQLDNTQEILTQAIIKSYTPQIEQTTKECKNYIISYQNTIKNATNDLQSDIKLLSTEINNLKTSNKTAQEIQAEITQTTQNLNKKIQELENTTDKILQMMNDLTKMNMQTQEQSYQKISYIFMMSIALILFLIVLPIIKDIIWK